METLARLSMRITGVIDVVLGVGLCAAPSRLLTTVGIRDTTNPSFVRLLGAHVAAIGAVSVDKSSDEPIDVRLLSLLAGAKIVGAVVLVRAGRSVAGGRRILPALGLAELGLGVIYLGAALDARNAERA